MVTVTQILCETGGDFMFLGEYAHTIDDKGRLTIPAKFRSDLAAGLVLTRGFDQNLMLYPVEGWKDLAASISERGLTNQRVRAFRRRVFSGAADLTPDRQGRILVPAYLREFAGIDGSVVVAGMFDFIEIWSVENWENKRTEIEDSDWEDLGF